MFSYRDCVEKGLLRKNPASIEKSKQSLLKAKKWLADARKAVSGKAFNSAIIAAYMVMFHAARSILFRDGWREKSHACVARYLEENYVKTGKLEIKWLDLLDYSRETRHNEQYDLSFFSTEEDAKHAIESASRFYDRIKSLLQI